MNSVAVCDTEPIAIEGLRSLLESADGLRVVAAESSLAEGMAAVEELRPSVLVLDKSFGMQAVMDWLKRLRGASFRTAVVIWSRLITESEALRFLQAGAAGVVRKTASLETLLSCLDTVISGATWMEEEMLAENDGAIRHLRSPLTARELQVMELVERGLKNKDIATELGIRTGTVKIHLKHIFEKTGIRGRYGLALSGLKEKGLLASTPVAM
ncbi:MAG: LuxR C-terminal-related transcriptional regulator [Bryobacteraceae bacterium]